MIIVSAVLAKPDTAHVTVVVNILSVGAKRLVAYLTDVIAVAVNTQNSTAYVTAAIVVPILAHVFETDVAIMPFIRAVCTAGKYITAIIAHVI